MMYNNISTRDVQPIFSNNNCIKVYEWLSQPAPLLVEFATFEFATIFATYMRIRYFILPFYAHTMSIIYQFPQTIYGNFCGSYLKKLLSSSTKDYSYKHMASPWELTHQLLYLLLYGRPRKTTVNG